MPSGVYKRFPEKRYGMAGKKHTEAWKKKMSIAQKGEKNHNYGKHTSEETKRKQSIAHKGMRNSPSTEFQKGQIPWIKGKHHTEEVKKKLAITSKGNSSHLGCKHTEEAKKKMGKKGSKHPLYGKHHSEATKRKISDKQKGKNNSMFGKPLSEEHRKKIREANKRRKYKPHTAEAKRKISESNKGKRNPHKGVPRSEATRKKIGLAHVGVKNYNWRGGITPLTKLIRDCFKYRQWRSDIFTRDDFTCQECGARSGKGALVYLEEHHKKPFAVILKENKITTMEEALACEELWNINNGQTLCRDICHKKVRKKTRRIN